jgi:hypothetical protein
MKRQFSQQIFEKYSNIHFNENPSRGSRVVPCGLTDITNGHFAPFCERDSERETFDRFGLY